MSSRRISAIPFIKLFTCFALATFAEILVGQTQNVQTIDAGGGAKQEIVRDASGQVVENRTYESDGKLRSRVNSIYVPGHFAPDQVTTAYFPDGKTVNRTSKITYDPSANFLSEETALFDQSGKHIEGHKLLHDPVDGMFRCWKWNAQSQKLDRIVCPSGEESGAKPAPMKPLTQEDAVKMLAAARTAATAQQKSERMTPKNMVTPPVIPTERKFAIVLPADLSPGKQVSGSVEENPLSVSVCGPNLSCRMSRCRWCRAARRPSLAAGASKLPVHNRNAPTLHSPSRFPTAHRQSK